VTPERWRQVEDLFHAALEQRDDARAAFLAERTGTDTELRREVESLLASHGRSSAFLDEPAWAVAADLILDEPMVSLTGRQIGTYKVLQEIGRGGVGVVYAAEDVRLGREVALKALAPAYTQDPARRQRLKREARAAAALSHPAIATIYALEEIDGAIYIVSELVRGRTLREELRGGALPPARLLPTLCDIASAMAAAHARGIVHRDLKPENIVRRDDGQVKILDFGLALMLGDPGRQTETRLTQAGLVLGTPGYMAPEQLAGREVDARADIFAFGVLAWELATGEHPFGADAASLLTHMTDFAEGRAAALSRPLPLPGLDLVVRRCLRGHAGDRYQTSTLLLEDLRTVAESGAATAALLPGGRRSLWWWQFHQAAIAAVNTVTPITAWAIRRWLERPYGSWIFYTVLALATISVTLRLNLLFTSRVHPDTLETQRARLFPAVAAADALLAAALMAASAAIAGAHDEVGALLLVIAIVMLASLALVEPATTRAAGIGATKGTRGTRDS
jgi:serine/threonine protein kinase